MSEPGFDQAEFMRQIEAELRRLRVSDFLVQTTATLAQLAFQRLQGETRDLAQARLAIDAMKALAPIVGESVSPEARRDLDATISSMQLAFAAAAAQAPAAPAAEPEPAAAPEPEPDGAGG